MNIRFAYVLFVCVVIAESASIEKKKLIPWSDEIRSSATDQDTIKTESTDNEKFSIGLGTLSPSYSQKVGKNGNTKLDFNHDQNGYSYSVSNKNHGITFSQQIPAEKEQPVQYQGNPDANNHYNYKPVAQNHGYNAYSYQQNVPQSINPNQGYAIQKQPVYIQQQAPITHAVHQTPQHPQPQSHHQPAPQYQFNPSPSVGYTHNPALNQEAPTLQAAQYGANGYFGNYQNQVNHASQPYQAAVDNSYKHQPLPQSYANAGVEQSYGNAGIAAGGYQLSQVPQQYQSAAPDTGYQAQYTPEPQSYQGVIGNANLYNQKQYEYNDNVGDSYPNSYQSSGYYQAKPPMDTGYTRQYAPSVGPTNYGYHGYPRYQYSGFDRYPTRQGSSMYY